MTMRVFVLFLFLTEFFESFEYVFSFRTITMLHKKLNYTAICNAIAETDYAGYLAHEFTPTGDPVEAMKDAFARCDVG